MTILVPARARSRSLDTASTGYPPRGKVANSVNCRRLSSTFKARVVAEEDLRPQHWLAVRTLASKSCRGLSLSPSSAISSAGRSPS
jgi:hypothetical protein